jgi:hypothetical protein
MIVKGSTRQDGVGHLPAVRGGSWSSLIALIVVALALLGFIVAPASADEAGNVPGQPYPLSEVEGAGMSSQDMLSQLVDSQAAKELPHREIDREEATELAESVFGSFLETSAGPFSSLHVEEFLSDNAAIVAPKEPSATVTVGGKEAAEEEAEKANGPLLLESTVPLRTENEAGQDRVVDLGLKHDEGELQPTNPLVEVGIPDELGDGIELPGASLELETGAATQERAPSILGENVAFYPNVARDTDFAVATTPTGIETFTQIRSADAPESQTLHLNLEDGAVLEAASEGGAVATAGDEEVLSVTSPTAIDANGNSVPVSLEVSGDSLVLNAAPSENTAFPILIDPVISSTWKWAEQPSNQGLDEGNGKGSSLVWRSWRNTLAYSADNHVPWASAPSPLWYPRPGITVTSGWEAPVEVGAQANWNYYVPRYFSDYEKFSLRPTSFIQNMVISNLQYATYSSQSSPWLAVGLWDEKLNKWVSVYSRNGTEGSIGEKYWNLTYNFPNPAYVQSAKNFGIGLLSSEAGANNGRILYVGYAAVSLNDLTKPAVGSFQGPEKWQNATAAEGFKIEATDSGLGMKYLRFEGEKTGETYLTELYCSGTNEDPCPRTWNTSIWKGYPAASLSTGIHLYTVSAFDVLGNEAAEHPKVPVKIDHTAPSLTLSGTMTQQASLGYKRPQYVLHLEGVDGVSGAPQAGIASSEVTVDGKVVDSTKAGCATQNCSLSRDWTLKSGAYPAGEHKVVASVTDGAGNTTTKSLTIKTEADTTAPTLETGGTLVTAPEGWVEQVSRSAWAYAEDGKGYGVTSLTFSIDGKVVKSLTQACSSGGCEGEITSSLNMAGYTAGAHSAEIVAKDGAGNVSKKAWTINVNPSGTVPSSEAVKTLEASDSTSESMTIAPTSEVVEPAEREAGNDPSLVVEGSSLKSDGTAVESTMTIDAGNGYTLNGGEESFHIEPTKSSASETNIEVKNGIAGVAANTTGGVDTVIRPLYDGIQAFQDIRQSTAPETYSWKVQLHSGQSVKAIDETHVGIYYAELELLAMTISAETAHDAIGKAVPTSLSVSEGNILTLTVHHHESGTVYPVAAGSVFQPSYETIIVPGPPTKQQEEEEKARELTEQQVKECAERLPGCLFYKPVAYERVSAPRPLASNATDDEGASASSAQGASERDFEFTQCMYEGPGGCIPFALHLEGTWEYNHKYAWWKKTTPKPKCPYSAHGANVTLDSCDWAGKNHQPDKAGGYHISAQGLFHVAPGGGPVEIPEPITEYMYASGYANGHNTAALCNPTVSC